MSVPSRRPSLLGVHVSDSTNELSDLPEFPSSDVVQAPAPIEQIGRGLLFSLASVFGGLVLTIVVWRLGFIASITSFVLAAGAVYLYAKGARTAPRRGLVPLVAIILLGVVACFFGVIASDAWDAYDELPMYESRLSFIGNNIFRGEVIKEYSKDMGMFALFAGLGIFSTMRRLVAAR